ncbi:MAG: alpha/beta fold hydrolase [Pseudomonadota bacterium]
MADVIDRSVHAATAHFTLGLSPAALSAAYLDWATHLAASPGTQTRLVEKAIRKSVKLARYTAASALYGGQTGPCIEPLPQDRRFENEAWQQWPYTFIYQSFLLQQQWWHNATTGIRGVTRQHESVVEFASRQLLDMISPTNFVLTNPEVLQRTMNEGGMNFVRGAQNFMEDWERAVFGRKPVGTEDFQVGIDVAVTPGKVIYRNRLIELIQYDATTDSVHPEPIFIVPAWIMKYYILDLSPRNSLVKYLTSQGFTVFMVSWKNPGPEERDLGMDAYRRLGIMDALDAVTAVVPDTPVHAVGYCLGGTILSIAASAMARDGDTRLASLTLLAAQTDFTEAGELMLFINDSQLTFLEDMMWEQGFLDTKQMAGTFQMLRSNDLVWSRLVREYMMGERSPMNDLMAWNADATRMPYRMHSEYLRHLYLENTLSKGHFEVDGKPIALTDIRVPIFAVGTTRDHVAPWRSVFKISLLTDTETTFLLTTGGHNAGIVSEIGRLRRSYQVASRAHHDPYADPDTWAASVEHKDGSWWPQWASWLKDRSSEPGPPPGLGASDQGYPCLAEAPGTYVMQE